MIPKFTSSIKTELLKKVMIYAINEELTKHNFYQKLSNAKMSVAGEEFPDEPKSHREQYVSSLFSRRINAIHELAKSLKLINEELLPARMDTEQFFISVYRTTKFGLYFHRSPSFLKLLIVSVFCLIQKLTKTTTKYKWLFGLISFITLAAKVWHSGVVEKGWILISALAGVVSVFILSLFT